MAIVLTVINNFTDNRLIGNDGNPTTFTVAGSPYTLDTFWSDDEIRVSPDIQAALLGGDATMNINGVEITDIDTIGTNKQVEEGDVAVSFTTDDITEGTTNLYFPEAPNDGQDYVRKNQAWAVASTSGVTNHSGLTLDDGTNPHGTTQSDVGLGNVDNTSDTNKPVSTAQAAADTAVQNFSVQRANHSGTQTASTISDFDTEVSNNTDVAANTADRHVAATVLDSSNINLGITGQQITADLIATGVTPGTYNNATVTVDANGRVTSITESFPQHVADNADATTTTTFSTTGVVYLTLAAAGLVPGGRYLISGWYIWSHDSANNDFFCEVRNFATLIPTDRHQQEPKDSGGPGPGGTDQKHYTSFEFEVTPVANSVSIDLNFGTTAAADESTMYNAFMKLTRIA